MSGMAIPKWATEEATNQMKDALTDVGAAVPVARDLRVHDGFSTHFAEYEVKGSDVLVHFFPRSGPQDQWDNGRYINRCRSCRAEVRPPRTRQEQVTCDRCGPTRLLYVQGRNEKGHSAKFPDDVQKRLVHAIDQVWLEGVAIEEVPEVGAYVMQIQNAKNTANTVGLERFMDKLCEAFDAALERG